MAFRRPGGYHGQGLDMLHHMADEGGTAPFATRKNGMYLDTVKPAVDTLRGQIWCYKADAQALRNHDIAGATTESAYHYKNLWKDSCNIPEPIPGTSAKTHYPDVNRPVDLNLNTSDIKGAQPDSHRFQTPRTVNPLAPEYPLPSFRALPEPPPRAAVHEGRERDWSEHKGAMRRLVPERNYSRDPNEGRDIELSQSNERRRLRQGQARHLLESRDVTGEVNLTMMRKTARASNPLVPDYAVPCETTHPFRKGEGASANAPGVVGRIEGSTPRVLTWDNGEPQTSLVREDIPGTVPQRYKGHVPFNLYDPEHHTPYSQFHGCDDIEGAQVGTRKAGTM